MVTDETCVTIKLTRDEAEKLMIILEDSDFYDDIFKNKLMNIIDQILYPDSYE